MEILVTILNFAIWPLCLVILGLILLQGGAGDVSSAFGGGGQLDTTLGVGASRKMAKLTGWLAVAFFVVVIILALPRHEVGFKSYLPGQGSRSASAAVTPSPVQSTVPVITPAGVSPGATVAAPASAPSLMPKAEAVAPVIGTAVAKTATVVAQAATAAAEAVSATATAAASVFPQVESEPLPAPASVAAPVITPSASSAEVKP